MDTGFSRLETLQRLASQAAPGTSLARKIQHNLAIAQSGGEPARALRVLEGLVPAGPPSPLDVEFALVLYNCAAALRGIGGLEGHARARVYAERLMVYLDALDDVLAMKASILLLDILLLTRAIDDARALIERIEARFFGLLATASSAGTKKGAVRGGNDEDSMSDDDGEDDKAAISASSIVVRIDEQSFKLVFHLYKARFHLQVKSFRPARRELKNSLSLNRLNHAGLFLKAYSESLRGNLKKSAKLLNSTQRQTKPGDEPTGTYLYNFGGLYLAERMPSAALFSTQRAIAQPDSQFSQHFSLDGSTSTAMAPPRLWLNYQAACAMLLRGRGGDDYLQALDTFVMVATTLTTVSDALWLRLGECAVALHYFKRDEEAHVLLQKVASGHENLLSCAAMCIGRAIAGFKAAKESALTLSGLAHAHCSLAYVHLSLKTNLEQAAENAQTTLAVLNRLGHHRFTKLKMHAVHYLAESLVLLGRTAEVESLLASNVETVQATTTVPKDANDLSMLRLAMRINLSISHYNRNRVQEALQVLEPFLSLGHMHVPDWLAQRNASSVPIPPRPFIHVSGQATGPFTTTVVTVVALVLLKQKNYEAAVETLRNHREYFPI